jgi:hypothetical protein
MMRTMPVNTINHRATMINRFVLVWFFIDWLIEWLLAIFAVLRCAALLCSVVRLSVAPRNGCACVWGMTKVL